MSNSEIKPLTEEEIRQKTLGSGCDRISSLYSFEKGANWAKERTEAYWKQRCLEIAEQALYKGVFIGSCVEDQPDYESWAENEMKEYLEHVHIYAQSVVN